MIRNQTTEDMELDIESMVGQEATNLGNVALGNNPPPKDELGQDTLQQGIQVAGGWSTFIRNLNKGMGRLTGGLTEPRTTDMLEKARSRKGPDGLDAETQDVVSGVLDEQELPPPGSLEGAPGATPLEGGIDAVDLDTDAVLQRIEQDGAPTAKRTDVRNLNIERHAAGAKADIGASIEEAQTADDIAAVFDAVAEEIGEKHVVRHNTTLEEMTLADVKKELEPFLGKDSGTRGLMTDRQLYATRMVLTTLGTDVGELATKIAEGDATSEMMLNFQKKTKALAAVQNHLRGNVREVARALQQQSVIAKTLGAGSLNDIDELMNVAHMTPEQMVQHAKVISENIKKKGPIGGLKPDWLSKMNSVIAVSAEYWKASILSGPETHLVNIMGNGAYNAWENLIIRPVSGVIGEVRGLTGLGDQADRVRLGESVAASAGALAGLRDSFGIFWRTLAKDDSVFNTGGKGETQGLMKSAAAGVQGPVAGPIARGAAEVANSPFRALQAEDDLFKTIAYREEATALSVRQAYAEGLSGADAFKRGAEILEDIPLDIHEQSLTYAKNLTYTNTESPGVLGQMGSSVKKLTAAYPILQFVMPFVNTPVNLMQRSIDMSVLSTVSPQLHRQIMAGGAQADVAMAKMVTGTAFTGLVYHFYANNQITGNGPENWEQRKILEKTGWKPNSILVDGTYIPYKRTDPFAASIAGLVDTLEAAQYSGEEQDVAMLMNSAVFGIARHMMDGTFLRGADDLFAILDGKKSMADYGAGIAAGFVPLASLQRSAAKFVDPQPRRSSTDKEFQTGFVHATWEKIQKAVPGLSRSMRPVRHWDGSAAIPDNNRLAYAISPIKMTDGKPVGAVDKALIANGVAIPEPDPMISFGSGANAVHLSLIDLDNGAGQVYDMYFKRVGAARKEFLTEMVQDDQFKELTPGPGGEQKLRMRQAIHQAKKQGLMVFLEEDLMTMYKKDPEEFNSIASYLGEGPDALYEKIQELVEQEKRGTLSEMGEEQLDHIRIGRGKSEQALPQPQHAQDFIGFD